MKRYLTVRLMPAVYFNLCLKLDLSRSLSYDLQAREVYLSNIENLDIILNLLSELMQMHPKFHFCLSWEGKSYYFEKDGSFSIMNDAPISGI